MGEGNGRRCDAEGLRLSWRCRERYPRETWSGRLGEACVGKTVALGREMEGESIIHKARPIEIDIHLIVLSVLAVSTSTLLMSISPSWYLTDPPPLNSSDDISPTPALWYQNFVQISPPSTAPQDVSSQFPMNRSRLKPNPRGKGIWNPTRLREHRRSQFAYCAEMFCS